MIKHFLFAIIAMTITGAFLSKTHAEQTDAPTDVFLNEGDDDFSWPIEKPIEAKADGKKKDGAEAGDLHPQDSGTQAAVAPAAESPVTDAPPVPKKASPASGKPTNSVAKSQTPKAKPATKTPQVARQVATATTKKTKSVDDKKKKKTGKKPASVDDQSSDRSNKADSGKVATQGEYKFLKSNCVMRRGPASTSASLTTIKGNKKIWVEDQGNGWVKGFREKGHGFLNKNCFK